MVHAITVVPRRFLVSSVVLSLIAALVVLPAETADAAPGRTANESAAEDRILAHHLAARGGGLARSADLDAVARSWSDVMADTGRLGHNPDYTRQVSGWSALAENVAYRGPGDASSLARTLSLTDRLAEGWMASATHRANILDRRYPQAGIGVSLAADGTVWATVVFRTPTGSATPPPATADPAPAPTPAPATTPTAPPPTSAPAPSTGADDASAAPAVPSADDAGADDARQRAAAAERDRIEQQREETRRHQRRMTDLGWYTGAPDGIAGPLTATAVRDFQQATGMPSTGVLDPPTVAALGRDGAWTRTAHDRRQRRIDADRAERAVAMLTRARMAFHLDVARRAWRAAAADDRIPVVRALVPIDWSTVGRSVWIARHVVLRAAPSP